MCVSPPFVSAHWIWWLSAESASPFLFFWYISYPPMMNVVQEVSRIERRRKWTIFWSWGRFFSSPIDIHFNQQLDLMAISLHLLLNRIESIFYDFFFQEEWKFQFCFFFFFFFCLVCFVQRIGWFFLFSIILSIQRTCHDQRLHFYWGVFVHSNRDNRRLR